MAANKILHFCIQWEIGILMCDCHITDPISKVLGSRKKNIIKVQGHFKGIEIQAYVIQCIILEPSCLNISLFRASITIYFSKQECGSYRYLLVKAMDKNIFWRKLCLTLNKSHIICICEIPHDVFGKWHQLHSQVMPLYD